MFDNLKDYIDPKSYNEFAGPDWPTFEQVIEGKPSDNPVIQQEVVEFIGIMKDRAKSLRINDHLALSEENQQRQQQVFFSKDLRGVAHCTVPWNTMGVNSSGHVFICSSPSWVPKFLGSLLDVNNLFDILNSKTALKIRQEILSGRYYYCNNTICNFFKNYSDYNKQPIDVSELPLIDSPELHVTTLPRDIILDFDYTCNFKCPSCRTEIINWNDDFLRTKVNNKLVEKIKTLILDNAPINRVTTIRWAGGEPFMSNSYIELFNYIIAKGNKNIQNIVQTNGSMLKSKTAVNLLPYIQQLRISYDAATEETYNKIRVNGNWNKLLDNTEFIINKAQQSGTKISLDFVVQLDNYKEIPAFVQMCKDFKVQHNIQRMWNWGTWPEEVFKQKNVWHIQHPLHNNVVEILRSQGIPIAKA